MIFKDKVEEKIKIIRPEMDKLLDIAYDKQFHKGDLLLFYINGFFQEEMLLYNQHAKDKINPHVIGPGSEGHSEQAHYSFIHKYRTTNEVKLTYLQYIEELKWTTEKQKYIEELTDFEETTVQLEMLIYLKFWEADLIIKKLYQFVRALHGEHYNWYFKIAESNRHKDCTGTRREIIQNSIRDRIEIHSPIIAQLIKDTYKTQIRNSISHSNYSFLGRHIHLNNYVKEDIHSQLHAISFDNWIDLFHNTLVLHNEYIRLGNIINNHYAKIALQHGNIMEILISEKEGKQYPLYIEYRQQWNDWKFKM